MKPSHSSHSSWKSPKDGDYHITHRTTTALYCHFYLAEVETIQLSSNSDPLPYGKWVAKDITAPFPFYRDRTAPNTEAKATRSEQFSY